MGTDMDDCIFCRILRGDAEGSIVHREAGCTALMTIEPVTEGHVLVIPDAHHVDIRDVPPDTAGDMFRLAQKVAGTYATSGIRCEGVNVVMCNGAAAGQTVFHAHIHVNPRFAGDGFSWNLPPGFDDKPTRAELDAVAAKLGAALRG